MKIRMSKQNGKQSRCEREERVGKANVKVEYQAALLLLNPTTVRLLECLPLLLNGGYPKGLERQKIETPHKNEGT